MDLRLLVLINSAIIAPLNLIILLLYGVINPLTINVIENGLLLKARNLSILLFLNRYFFPSFAPCFVPDLPGKLNSLHPVVFFL